MLKCSDLIKHEDLVRFQIESFDWLLDHGLQEVIDEKREIDVEISGYSLKLGKIKVGKPVVHEAGQGAEQRYPYECRIRDLTYSAPLILEFIENSKPVEVEIGHLPIMLKSKACLLRGLSREELIKVNEDPKDPGGYFIINGTERVLVLVEDLAPNKIITTIDTVGGKEVLVAKVFSVRRGFRARVTVERHDITGAGGSLYSTFPGVPTRLPLIMLMKALGLSDEEILNLFDDEEAKLEIMMNLEIYQMDKDEAFEEVGKRIGAGHAKVYQRARVTQVFNNFLLPHLGTTEDNWRAKAVFLGTMARKVLELAYKKRSPEDKDHCCNKRLRLAGDLMQELFRVSFNKICRDIKYQLEKQYARHRQVNVKTAVRANNLTESICYALATGNWTGGRTGVSQVLERTNYLSSLSHRRRISSLLSKSHPHFEARDLHPTHWGRICPNETPEGQNCGLAKNLAIGAYLSEDVEEEPVENYIRIFGTKEWSSKQKGADVFLNGRLLGRHTRPELLVEKLRGLRREGKTHFTVSISYRRENNEVQIFTDRGRILRPLIIVEGGKPKLMEEHVRAVREGKLTLKDLVAQGVIEYLDAEEEENAYVAISLKEVTPEHTHLEINPALIFGVSAGFAPYSEHNSSPRITMAASMAKQGLGIYALNYPLRFDSRALLLHYPQVPLVKTDIINLLDFEHHPSGQNFVVAIMSYEGYNMEDAVILNRSSIERGLSRSTFFRTYIAEEMTYPSGQKDCFEIPREDVEGYQSEEAYAKLGADGIIFPETPVGPGDVLIGKTSPPRFLEEIGPYGVVEEKRKESSTCVRHMEWGVIDSVVLTETNERNKLVKVRLRNSKTTELGDKFASRHGQKGVVGLIVPHEDMPFTKDGVVPDLIINPHAIPSRMTIGHILETLGGKFAALAGCFIDGTPFENVKEKDLRRMLKELGFEENGKEVLYDGKTGKRYEAEIFVGIVYYQKLHHLVANKIHARSRGPVQMLTRQPTEGRAREGGLRFGEMERDCLVAHGASMLLKDRLLDESDRVVVPVCSKCELLATRDFERNKLVCPVCGDASPIYEVEVAYAFKLLLTELMGMCIYPKLKLVDKV